MDFTYYPDIYAYMRYVLLTCICVKQKHVGGQVITHLQLAESTWNPDKKRSETKIIYHCGRIDEEDDGSGDADQVRGSIPAGARTSKAPRKRGKRKHGRTDVPQMVVELAVTRDGFPVRH